MLATTDRQTALRLLGIEHAAVRALIEELTDEEKTRPDTIQYGLYADQELSFKDLLAHLMTYEAYALEALAAWKRGEKHWITDAMRSARGSMQVHYSGIEERSATPLHSILEEWEATQANLMAALRSLTDDEWYTPAPYPDREPSDLGGMLEAILVAPPRPPYRHLPVHIPDPDVYIRSLRR